MTKTLLRCLPISAAFATALLLAPAVSHGQPIARGPGVRVGVAAGPRVGVNVGVAPMYRVRVAPPALRVDVRPVQPSPNHVWMSGYWRWNQGQHVWAPGRWEMGRPGHVWVDSHWVHDNGQWAFYDGRWAASPQGYQQEVVVNTAPLAPQYEVTPSYVEPGHEWIGGHYEWHGGNHVWMPGRYEQRPERSYWEHHRWERGQDNSWRYNRGRWHQYPQ